MIYSKQGGFIFRDIPQPLRPQIGAAFQSSLFTPHDIMTYCTFRLSASCPTPSLTWHFICEWEPKIYCELYQAATTSQWSLYTSLQRWTQRLWSNRNYLRFPTPLSSCFCSSSSCQKESAIWAASPLANSILIRRRRGTLGKKLDCAPQTITSAKSPVINS